MRKMKKPPAEELRKRKEEPLAEGLQIVVPTDSRGRLWSKMSDEQIVEFAQKFMEENEITGKRELKKADSGLCYVLRRRGLNDEVGFVEKQRKVRPWKNMSDEQIIEFAKKSMKEKKITRRKGLKKADPGLYNILRKRGLNDEVGFEDKIRYWKDMNDEEIVEFAQKFMEENEITGKRELKKADSGLYNVLREKGLLNKVGFVEKLRRWMDLSNDELVEFAKNWMKENAINRRVDMEDNDDGIYCALRKRGLLDRAFADIEQQKNDLARDAVIDALEAFAANDNDSAEDDVA